MIDSTAQKDAPLRAQESERRFRTLYDDSPAMFLTLNTDGSIIMFVNKFVADLVGCTVLAAQLMSVLINLFYISVIQMTGKTLWKS